MRKIHAFDRGIYNPQEMANVKIDVESARKENEILFTEDFFNEEAPKDWEVRYDNGYPTVFYDPYLEKYRCYYSTFVLDESSSEVSLAERKHKDYEPSIHRVVGLCYAESDDGVTWDKPNLNLTKWNGTTDNNIIDIFLHGTSVMLDENESDSKRRYKMFTKIDYGNGIHYLAVAFSEDGIHFGDYIKLQGFNPRADTYNYIHYEEETGMYVLITRIWRDSMRIPVLSYSNDFIHWSEPEEIMSSPTYENQIYSMPFFKRSAYYIGLASVYHEGDRLADDFDKVDLHLTYSYDKKNWHYINLETPFIKRGEGDYQDGAFDNGCIFSAAPVRINEKDYFYYLGGNGQHTNYRETSLARASIKNDRYAYLAQKNQEQKAIVYTNGFVFLGEELAIDAEINEGGFLKVEFYANDHTKLDIPATEFTTGDAEYVLQIDPNLFRKITRLKLTFSNAKIYSFEGAIDTFRVEDDNSLLRA